MDSESENIVVVSGAGTGIGQATAQRLAAAGFGVVAVGRRLQPLDQLTAGLGHRVCAVAADVATVAGCAAVADRVAAAGCRCAGVVAAAGGLSPDRSPAGGLDGIRRDWQASFESNVLTAVLLVQALRAMLERDSGRVVLLSSVAALRGSGGGPYGAMKAALHGWV